MPTLRTACSCATALLFLFSCNNNKTGAVTDRQQRTPLLQNAEYMPEQAINVSEFQRGYEQLITQQFTVSAREKTVITAEKGLKVTVNPSALIKNDGSPVSKAIEVSIIELTNSEDLFKSNAATMSNGKLLVSGGSYYIGMESDGQKLSIRKGSSLKVEFPKLRNGDMELFYGNRETGSMNWIPANTSLKSSAESLRFEDDSYEKDTFYLVNTLADPHLKNFSIPARR